MEYRIKIKKSNDFSKKSQLYLFQNGNRIYMSGHDYYELKISEKDIIFAKHKWVESRKLLFTELKDNEHYEITPILGKNFGFFFVVIFSLSMVSFFVTKMWWTGIPVILLGLFIFLVLSVLSHKYLIFRKINK